METRWASYKYNLWSCAKCSNDEYHLYDNTELCVRATTIKYCNKYK